jgi:hypothetical protein
MGCAASSHCSSPPADIEGISLTSERVEERPSSCDISTGHNMLRAASPSCSSSQSNVNLESIAGTKMAEFRCIRAAAPCEKRHVAQPFNKALSLSVKPTSDKGQPANLNTLPIELLLQISTYLPPSSRVSLTYVSRHSYRRLDYRMIDFAIEHIMLPRMYIGSRRRNQDEIYAEGAERLKLLCMLERDLLVRRPRVVCSGCFSTHDVSLFTPEELAKSGLKRLCVGRLGRMWICSKTSVNFDYLESPEFWRDIFKYHTCSGCVHQHRFFDSDLKVVWPLVQTWSGAEVPILKLREILSRLDIPLCPHIRSGNPVILRTLAPHCGRNKWKLPFERCSCGNCSGAYPCCSTCGMKVKFDVSLPCGYQRQWLVMEIRRGRNYYTSATDPNWIVQTVLPEASPCFQDDEVLPSGAFDQAT